MAISGSQQAGLYYLRRRNRSQQFIAQATQWVSGLTITPGAIVQNFNLAWEAQNSGTTTGGNGPQNSGGALYVGSDGIEWLHIPLLLVAPTPIT
jgi:hypothetical protein